MSSISGMSLRSCPSSPLFDFPSFDELFEAGGKQHMALAMHQSRSGLLRQPSYPGPTVSVLGLVSVHISLFILKGFTAKISILISLTTESILDSIIQVFSLYLFLGGGMGGGVSFLYYAPAPLLDPPQCQMSAETPKNMVKIQVYNVHNSFNPGGGEGGLCPIPNVLKQ